MLNPNNQPIIEQEAQTLGEIIDLANGTKQLVPVSVERVMIDPTTGARQFTSQTYSLRLADGVILPANESLACRSCQALISKYAATRCQTCRTTICHGCAGSLGLCKTCKDATFWDRFWAWLLGT